MYTKKLKKKAKTLATRVIRGVKNIGAFSLGMFVGVCYGSVIATITSFVILS